MIFEVQGTVTMLINISEQFYSSWTNTLPVITRVVYLATALATSCKPPNNGGMKKILISFHYKPNLASNQAKRFTLDEKP